MIHKGLGPGSFNHSRSLIREPRQVAQGICLGQNFPRMLMKSPLTCSPLQTPNPIDLDNNHQRGIRSTLNCWGQARRAESSQKLCHSPHQSCSKASFTLCCSCLLALSITFTSLCSSSSTGSLTTSMARRLSRSVRHSMDTSKGKFFAWRARSAASFTWKKQPAECVWGLLQG